MALFKGRKQDKVNMGELLEQAQRAQALAQQSTQQFEGQMGMDVKSVMASAQAAMRGGGVEDLAAYSNRAARVSQSGVEMEATLRSFELGEQAAMFGGVKVEFELTVAPAGGAPYEVSSYQYMPDTTAAALAAGQRVTVKVAPNDPQCLMIWGTEATAATPLEDRIGRLEKLQALRASGVLTDSEFQAQKATLLGG